MGTKFVAEPLSRGKIRKFTLELRKLLKLENEIYFPVIPFLEVILPTVDSNFEFHIVPGEELPNKYAVAYPEENLIKIREDVYERAINGVPRDRFTIAHEIGHLILHTDNRIALAREIGIEQIPSFRDPEWQANTFAGEILVPFDLTKDMSSEEIQTNCGVSKSVAKIQIEKR